MKSFIKLLIFTIPLIALVSCGKNKKDESSTADKEAFNTRLNKLQTGSYGLRNENFRYDYTVSGTDENGNEVSGDINLAGKLGEGKIYSYSEKRTIEVVVESSGEGKAVATDVNGKKYHLKVK